MKLVIPLEMKIWILTACSDVKRIRTFPGHEWEFISQALREIQAELESKVVSVEPKTVAIQRLGHETFLETCFLSFSYLQLTFRKSSCYLDVKLVSKRFKN